MLVPKLFTTLKSYDRGQFLADLSAGVIVGIIALPLAIAFAIASGVSPDRGLYTAIVAGFIISLLGGSRVQLMGLRPPLRRARRRRARLPARGRISAG